MFITIKHIFMETCFCHGIQIFKLHVTLVHNSDFFFSESQDMNFKFWEKKITITRCKLAILRKSFDFLVHCRNEQELHV